MQHTGEIRMENGRGMLKENENRIGRRDREERVSNVASSAQPTGEETHGHNPNHHHVLG